MRLVGVGLVLWFGRGGVGMGEGGVEESGSESRDDGCAGERNGEGVVCMDTAVPGVSCLVSFKWCMTRMFSVNIAE